MFDLQAIAERHYESFVNACINNPLIDFMVKKIMDCYENPCENSSYEDCFERLYTWDAEYLVCDPMNCLISYLEETKKLERFV